MHPLRKLNPPLQSVNMEMKKIRESEMIAFDAIGQNQKNFY